MIKEIIVAAIMSTAKVTQGFIVDHMQSNLLVWIWNEYINHMDTNIMNYGYTCCSKADMVDNNLSSDYFYDSTPSRYDNWLGVEFSSPVQVRTVLIYMEVVIC